MWLKFRYAYSLFIAFLERILQMPSPCRSHFFRFAVTPNFQHWSAQLLRKVILPFPQNLSGLFCNTLVIMLSKAFNDMAWST
jgi:hypothetical protein